MSGFATVSLQMRGTGCSGGAFDLFGYPSDYDAYDAIEILANQSWVANGKVGMVGISFSGLSQFPAAGTDPPGLAAIAPMSPTDDLFSTGYPGGIYNNGFAAEWINSRISDAKAAATDTGGQLVQSSTTPISGVGQPWTYYEIDSELASSNGASSNCLSNQALHNQSQDLAGLIGPQLVAPGSGSGRDPALFDRRSMVDWAAHVNVPVFLSGALQDEQTGPQWPALIDAVPKTTPLFANMVNGGHIDSADPQTISRWLEFLDIYVADKVPTQPNALAALVLDLFASTAASVSAQSPLPALRFTTAPDVATARSEFAAQTPLVQALFDNGASSAGPGNIGSSYSAGFSSWPPAGAVTTLFLGAHGSLQRQPRPPVAGSTSFTLDPSVRPSTSLPAGGNVWAANPGWDWTPVPASDGIAFQTTPFTTATTVAGPATLGLWLKASAPVEDLQATITEVQPQTGQEEYVTSGFLRSTNQVDKPDSTALFTDPTYLGNGRTQSLAVPVLAGEDPHRPHRAYLPARHRAPDRHLSTGWRSPGVDVREPGQRPDGYGRIRTVGALSPDRQRGAGRHRHRGGAALRLAARGALPGLPGRGQPVVGPNLTGVAGTTLSGVDLRNIRNAPRRRFKVPA